MEKHEPEETSDLCFQNRSWPRAIISPDTWRRNRLRPGQSRTQKWPVLDASGVPPVDLSQWSLQIFGLVERENKSPITIVAIPGGKNAVVITERKRRKRDLHALNAEGMVLCNPRDREAAHRAEMEGIATDDLAAVTCRKCLALLYRRIRNRKESR
jgi:hypothetical protein